MTQYRFRGDTPPGPDARASVLIPVADAVDPGVQVLRLYDPIDDWGGAWGVSAKEFAAGLAALPEETHTIQLHINSPGGMVFEAVTILNQLRQYKARVVAVVDGLAASAASFIAAGADEVLMAPNTQLMIHDAWGLCVGAASDMRKTGDLLDRLSDNIAAIYAGKAGGDVVDWRTAMLAESWYSAEEAVSVGLADSILGDGDAAPSDLLESAVKASASVGAKYAGRNAAPAPIVSAGFPSARRDRLNSKRLTPRGY